MIKEKIAFTGIGQCGSNVVRENELNNCQCFYVNTSLEDLDTIPTDNSKKYHISGTKGMAKDRDFAKQVIESDYNDDKIVEEIYKKYANSSIYFFAYSTSGGTGGAMGNKIAVRMKERFPDKIVNVIAILPHDEEDMIMQANAIQCLEEIMFNLDKKLIDNVQILDNNSRDFDKKMSINKEYASILDKILSFQSDSVEGNLDEEELERIFMTPGILTISEIDNKDFAKEISEADKSSIFAKTLKDASTHGLILNKDNNNVTNRNLIRDVFGMATITHDTVWEEDFNIIISAGMKFNKSNIVKLKNNYNRLALKKKSIEESIQKQSEELEDIEIDFSAVKSTVKKTVNNETTTRTSRRGSLGARGETRYRR